jgi:hypothetical protein
MRKERRNAGLIATAVIAFLCMLSALFSGIGPEAKADPALPKPLPTLTLLPTVTPSILPVPGPTVTKYIPKPGPTVTKTVYKRVPVPGPTETIYITRQAPSPRVKISVSPSPVISVSPSPVPVVTKEPGKTVTVSIPKAIGISAGFLALGILISLVALWIAYATGYKDSDKNASASRRELLEELFGKKENE